MKTTRLDAVNDMLKAIGVMPVHSLSVTGNADASIAQTTLESTKKALLNQGWWFNTRRGVLLAPSGGQVLVPDNALSVKPASPGNSYSGEHRPVVESEGKLYDTEGNTFTFTSAVRVDMVVDMDFEELPEPARHYIAVRSARLFHSQVLGDEVVGAYTLQHEREALRGLEGDQVTKAPYTNLFEMRARRRFESLIPDPVGGQGGQGQRRQ